MRTPEVDPFELRLKLSKFLQGASIPQNIKGAISLCTRHLELASELFECIIEAIKEDVKNRRAVLSMLESLYEQASSFPYRILIETSFKSLVETCLNQSTPQNWAKNAAKVLPHPILLLIVTLALKNLLHAFPEEVQKDFTNLDESINDALGLYLKRSIVPDTSTNSFRTEAEQKFLRKKQAVLEQIEKDREGHKLQREICWSRQDGETLEHEFLSLYHQAKPFNHSDYQLAESNNMKFCNNNGIVMTKKYPKKIRVEKDPIINNNGMMNARGERKRISSPPPPVIILYLDEIIFPFGQLLHDRDTRIRNCTKELLSCIKEVARLAFFYNDLREFDQPHVQYYCDDDDGRRLNNYDFAHDNLALFVRGKLHQTTTTTTTTITDSKFYQERAFRYRMSSLRYESIHEEEFKEYFPRDLERDYNSILRDLDYLLEGLPSRFLEALELLLQNFSNVCFITAEHLSLALARNVVFKINKLIPVKSLYSTTKFDLDWVLSEIRLKYGSANTYYVIGASNSTNRSAEKLGWKFLQVLRPSDLSIIIKDLNQRKPNFP